jgi:polyhydroxybutyrate depolymerase
LIVAVPADYHTDAPRGLILAFHGRTTPAERARWYFGLEDGRPGAPIIAYPQALRQEDGTFIWREDEDVALFDAVLEWLAGTYCIDERAVFAVGHSLGATFANDLACVRAGELRGVASVAGGLTRTSCGGGAAAMLLHNPADAMVPVAQGQYARDVLAVANGHLGPSAPSVVGGLACDRIGVPEAENPVLWCLYDAPIGRSGIANPHGWPEGAGKAILDFFSDLMKPGGRAPADLPTSPQVLRELSLRCRRPHR